MSVRVDESDGRLVVSLTGLDRVFSFRSRLSIPKSQITSIRVMATGDVPYTEGTWLRAPGAYVPGLIRHGSYGTSPHREFWAVYRQKDVLVIDVVEWDYSRLVLATADPHVDAMLLGHGPGRST